MAAMEDEKKKKTWLNPACRTPCMRNGIPHSDLVVRNPTPSSPAELELAQPKILTKAGIARDLGGRAGIGHTRGPTDLLPHCTRHTFPFNHHAMSC